ncbi:MAG: hypothetical protein ACJ746_10130 [Bryobacteraceae bacterium]
MFLQGDTRHAGNPSDGVIARRQIAQVLVASLTSEAALRKTFHPGVEYWLYENASMSANSSPTSIPGTPAMHGYFARTSTSNFSALGGGVETLGFSLQGSIIPEPGTLVCTSSGFFVLLVIWRMRHKIVLWKYSASGSSQGVC